MSTVWRKAMIALGLGDDDDYEEYDDDPIARPQAAGAPSSAPVHPRSVQPVANRTASVSPLPGVPGGGVPGGGVPGGGLPGGGGGHGGGHGGGGPSGGGSGQVRFPNQGGPPEQPPVRAVSASSGTGSAPGSQSGSTGVRTIVRPTAKPHVVAPRSFLDAPQVADRFKSKQPVIVNLQGVERDLSRRLVDFASGLCYGLGGQMEKVATDVFLLTPADVEVSAEERQRLSDAGLYDS